MDVFHTHKDLSVAPSFDAGRCYRVDASPDMRLGGKLDYIIGFRASHPDRVDALQFVIACVQKTLPAAHIVVVEQDAQPVLDPAEFPGCEVIFVRNDQLYNRGWGFNIGANAGSRPQLLFADADVFLTHDGYRKALQQIEIFEAVDPKRFYLWNVHQQNPTDLTYYIEGPRYGNTMAGGIFLVQRRVFMEVGMWDERFEGWGGEDNAMEHVIRSYLSFCRLQVDAFHIRHARAAVDGRAQPNYAANRNLSDTICSLHGERLHSYMIEKGAHPKGLHDKYARLNAAQLSRE